MRNPYLDVLRTPGGKGLTASGFLARLPLSMAGIALLLLVVDQTGSYAVGGAASATWILANAVCAPAIARIVDRRGQARVVRPQVAVHLVGVLVILVLAAVEVPVGVLLVAVGLAGAVLPVVGSLVRARWAYLLPGSPLLRTAYSWESVVDEFVFIVGPVLVTVVAVSLSPTVALALTVLLGAAGTLLLMRNRRSEPPPSPTRDASQESAWGLPSIPLLVTVMALLGVVFAGVEVTVIASARESGQTEAAGVVLACWSVSSMATGLVLGSRREHFSLRRQLLVGSLVLLVTLFPLLLADQLVAYGVLLLFAGAAVSPTLIAGFALVEATVPAERITESLTLVSVGISVGFAVGSPGSGWLVDNVAPHAGFLVAIAAAVTTAVVVATGYRRLAD